MEEQERRLYHPFRTNIQDQEAENLLQSDTLINDEGDDEESLLSTVLPSFDRLDNKSSSAAAASSSRFPFWNGNDHTMKRRRWKRWAFFLCGFLFFVAFFTMLLLLFFDVIHVPDDHQHSGGPTTSPRGRFFQLSDVHMDLLYNAALNRTVFCRASNATGSASSSHFASPSRASDPSGSLPYGQYGCDSPVELVQSALGAMYEVDSKPDFILITGDLVAHGMPTWALQNQTVTLFTSMLRDVFPDTLVIPLLARNNDVYPDYHLPYGPTAWLEYLAALWSPWLNEEQQATFISGGYYSMKIPAAHKLRIIALNTVPYSVEFVPRNDTHLDPFNSCNTNPPADPNGQFVWLKAQLAQAKLDNEKVILAGHIPYGVNEYDGSINWCPGYVDSFLSVIYPFVEDVIINQIFAHYHLDEFRVLLSPSDPTTPGHAPPEATSGETGDATKPKAVSSVMIHPSISPLHDNNPSFRYYHYYRETGAIADYAHFYLDLALLDLMPTPPRWGLEYTFQAAYSVTGVDTKAFAWVWETITSGFSSHFARYFSYKTALYIANALPNLCALSSTGQEDYQRCLLQYGLAPSDPPRSEL